MIDLTDKCVYSGSIDNLNTQLTIKIEDKSYKVSVSDEHADEASIKSIKEILKEKSSKLDDLQKRAEEIGYILISESEYKELLDIKENYEVLKQKEVQTPPTSNQTGGKLKTQFKRNSNKTEQDQPGFQEQTDKYYDHSPGKIQDAQTQVSRLVIPGQMLSPDEERRVLQSNRAVSKEMQTYAASDINIVGKNDEGKPVGGKGIITVPKRIIDTTGETRIDVIKTNDKDLQYK